MIGLRATIRRFGSAIGFVSALLLVGTVWVVGTHHHDASSEHGCVVCTTAHAPAVIGIAVAMISAPRPVIAPVPASVAAAPAILAIGIAPSRAPPSI